MRYSRLDLSSELRRLWQLAIYLRWLGVVMGWLVLAPWAIGVLRPDIDLWLDCFTWTAVRYGLAFHPIATFCLLFCVGMTVSTLIRHGIYWWGTLSAKETNRLEARLAAIAQLSPTHPLRRWVLQKRD